MGSLLAHALLGPRRRTRLLLGWDSTSAPNAGRRGAAVRRTGEQADTRARERTSSLIAVVRTGSARQDDGVNAIVAVNVQVPSSGAAAIIADFAEHAIRVAYIARRDLSRLPEAEWRVPGIYVLIADDGSHRVYVGKSTDLRSRVMQHKQGNAHVPGWSRAVLVKRDTSNGFTSADVGYLEGRLSAELDARVVIGPLSAT